MKLTRKSIRLAALAAATALAAQALAGVSPNNVVTISISGSTAMRNFTISTAFATVEGNKTLTLSNGTYVGGPNGLIFGPNPISTVTLANGSTGTGIRDEWHEAGSVEGILELANDQIGYVTSDGGITGGIVDPFTSRNPSALNPVRIQGQSIAAPGGSAGGGTISSSDYNTYSAATFSIGGSNLQGGQNRVQWAISDVPAAQGFSTAGAASITAIPGTAGYGKGNPALTISPNTNANIGAAQGRQRLADATVLNMTTDKKDPATGLNYTTGTWNNAGVNNLVSKTVAITATAFAANPGTGLTSLNQSDAQSLQVLGRLPNGADFNVSTRDVNSGTRNVAALNTNVDPSWAVGENDAGNGYNLAAGTGLTNVALGTAAAQATIGDKLKFSGKTAGGGQLAPTVQNSRMAIGTLGLSDIFSSAASNANTTPLRGLAYSPTSYNSAGVDGSFAPVAINAATITNGTYRLWQQEQYVFAKRVESEAIYAASSASNYYKGDSTGLNGTSLATGTTVGNAALVSQNILDSVKAFPNPFTLNTPADGLLAQRFILPQFMLVGKAVDGGATNDISGNVTAGQTNAQWNAAFLGDPSANNFNLANPASITTGSGSIYGKGNSNGAAVYTNNIPITAANYLFGNFNQNGVRDFAALKTAALAQQSIAASNTMFDTNQTITNGTTVFNGLTKGDLIVMGDFDGNGKFDGKDLYLFAKGAALSDNTSTDTITATGVDSYSAALRNATLRKNAALDYLYTNATAQQKSEAATGSSPVAIANAFNKADINRDGLVNIDDAFIIDKFNTQDARSLNQSAAAVIDATTGKPAITTTPTLVNLWDVKLVDGSSVVGQADANALNDSKGLASTVQSTTWAASTVKPGSLTLTVKPITGSTVTVPAGATLTVAQGAIITSATISNAAVGTVSPFRDTTTGNGLAITVAGTGSLKIDHSILDRNNGTIAPTTVLSALSIGGSGLVNLTSSDLIVKNGDAAALNAAVGSYLTSGTGLGTDAVVAGKTSFTSTGFTGLAVFDNNDHGNPYFSSYDGVPLTSSDVIVKFTFWGDINLDGAINGADLAKIIQTLSTTGTGNYQNGDLNYDGLVNVADIDIFNRSQSNAGLFGGGSAFGDNGTTGAIPEPSSLALLTPALPLLTRRRRTAK